MKYALFLGCKIPYFVPQYETSTRLVCGSLDVELVDIEFNCCGYPVRHIDFESYILSAARNFALAEQQGLNIMTPCKCCYGSLKKAFVLLKEKSQIREKVNAILAEQELQYRGDTEVKHMLQVLHDEVGLQTIKEKISTPFDGLNIAVHYGCHALRPSNVTEFDDPANPRKFDELVEVTGAKSVDWAMRLQCCGNPLMGKNDDISMDLAEKKLIDAKQSGADALCVACTYCQIQFDSVQKTMSVQRSFNSTVPSILYPQLLGLSMGFGGKQLGLNMNLFSLEAISGHLVSNSR